MSEPPTKKIGSLRDRIAAFENKGSSPAPAPAPVPRPKPVHVTWQPKSASPPASPKRDTDDGEGKKAAGMSAADAKESIGKLSLKERMAALQGSAAFGGGPAVSPPPRPTGEKPKWKPPPVVQRVEPIGGEDEEKPTGTSTTTSPIADKEEGARSPTSVDVLHEGEAEEAAKEQEEGEPKDPEEEERQRRAALAARMARLGGARVGMAPPIFGKKSDIPPKRIPTKDEERPKEEEKPEEEEKPTGDATPKVETKLAEVSPTVQEAAAIELPPSTTEESAVSNPAEYFAAPEKGSTSTLSPDSATSPPVRSPAMPVPLGPKRAAPPRKRPAKSPSPAPPAIEQVVHESSAPLANKAELEVHDNPEESTMTDTAPESLAPRGDLEPEVTESQVQYLLKETTASEPVKNEVADKPTSVRESESQEHDASQPEPDPEVAEQPVGVMLASEEPQDKEEYNVEEPETHESQLKEELIPEPDTEKEQQLEEGVAEPAAPITEPEEEDEAARRKRIAERLAKSGGFNPFAGGLPPPLRRDSVDSADSPPLPTRRDSHQEVGVKSPPRRDSQQESIQTPLTATSLESEVLERKASVDSVQSGLESPTRKTSLDGGVSEEPLVFEQTTRTRELYAEPIAETMEYEDEATETRGEHEAGHDRREGFGDDQESETSKESDDQRATRETTHDEPETFEKESSVQSFPPPSARRPVPTSPAAYNETDEDVALLPPPPPRRDFPPPPARVVIPPPPRPAEVDVEAERVPSPELDIEEDAYSGHAREVEPKHEIDEREQRVSRDDDERVDAYLSGDKVNSARVAELDEHRGHQDSILPPPPPRHAAIPPPPPPVTEEEEAQEGDVPEEDEPVAALPPPPPRRSSAGVPSSPPTHIPTDDVFKLPETADPVHTVEADEPAPPPPPPPRHPRPTSQLPVPLMSNKPILPPLRAPTPEQEILNDSDVDPIDPEFYSPRSPLKSVGSGSLLAISPLSSAPPPPPARLVSPPPVTLPPPQRVVSPPSVPERTASPPSATSPPPPPVSARPHVAPPVPEQQEDQGEVDGDAEQTRRRTIAERMAKLGGIRFGAPPPIPAVRRPAPPPELEGERDEDEEEQKPPEPEERPLAKEEEDEFARKQRIAARIAGMGGMRFGMLPGTPAPKPPPRVPREEEEESVLSPPPPKRSAPAPPPPLAEEDHGEESDYQHVSDSDHAGHDESELEEVSYTDAEEEVPPPVPDRSVRRVSTGPPPIPHALPSPPPVPRTRPPAPPAFTYPPPPHPPPPPATQETQGDFVVVSQAESADEPPPSPPPRAARPPPRAPPRAPPSEPEAVKSQWEPQSIPNIDFGGETDLSFTGQWSEDSIPYPPGTAPAASETAPPQPPARSAPMPVEQHMTPDELMAHWGRVGVQVHEISAALFEKSKKSVIGDGSYLGFVNAVLSQVPNAVQPTDSLDSFGYLVYSQSVAAVHRRVSDIMPGDVVVVHDAKFKGHKGLQSYNQSVGMGEPLVGIIGDFEAKKSKVKVYQANQHVGQQSVESVSYRLEDLKSGSVKIFRVLEL